MAGRVTTTRTETTTKAVEIKTAGSEITATTNDGVATGSEKVKLPTDIDALIYFLTKNVAVTPKT